MYAGAKIENNKKIDKTKDTSIEIHDFNVESPKGKNHESLQNPKRITIKGGVQQEDSRQQP